MVVEKHVQYVVPKRFKRNGLCKLGSRTINARHMFANLFSRRTTG